MMKISLETVVSHVLFFEMNFEFYLEVNYGYEICQSSSLYKKLSKGEPKEKLLEKIYETSQSAKIERHKIEKFLCKFIQVSRDIELI
jgi:hypothetical protein